MVVRAQKRAGGRAAVCAGVADQRVGGGGFRALLPGQAQKDFKFNEAIQLIDSMLAPAVEMPPLADPPPNPVSGECYIVGVDPQGVWHDQSNCLASYSDAGWRFIRPHEGTSVFVRSQRVLATFLDGSWEIGTLRASEVIVGEQKVIGARAPAIDTPAGGGTVDVEARAALVEILDALRAHGLIET